jgi:hypothetical protein
MSSDQGILLKETSVAPITPNSTHGLIYVQNTTPNQLHYVDDGGSNFNLQHSGDGATVASTGNVSLASTLDGVTIDGVTLVAGNIVLLKDQSTPVQNGLYLVNTTPALATRVQPTLVGQNVAGIAVYISSGTINGGHTWTCTNAPLTAIVGTDSLTFAIISVVRRYLTAGAATFYAPQDGMYIVKASAGGGGGSGGHVSIDLAGGGGGASGNYAEIPFNMTAGQSLVFSIGTGGAGGAALTAGTVGNPTTITYSGTGKVYTLSGGNGGTIGTGGPAGAGGAGYYGGGGGSGLFGAGAGGISTFSSFYNGTTASGGNGGTGGFFGGTGTSGGGGQPGGGGGGPFGGNGGQGTTVGSAGLYGCGGGGGSSSVSTKYAGGNGGTGYVTIIL